MRILVIDPNGARASERAKAQALAEQGLSVSLLAPARARENYAWQRAPLSWQGRFRLVQGQLRGKPPNRCLFTSGLAQALRPAPQAVLCLGDENFWLTAQALAAQRLLAPGALFVCHSWRNLDFGPQWHPQPSRLLYEADTWLERRVFARASALVARNRQAARILRRRGFKGPVVYIPWAVDTGLFRPPQAPVGERPYTIGFVGRFSPDKGLDTLLVASRALEVPHVLRLVGNGPLEGWLHAQPRQAGMGRLEIVPAVAQEALPAIYAGLDVLVLPSRPWGFDLEQFGRVLAEAMACGVAVVGSDAGAIPEVIGPAGLVFPQGDAAALAQALMALARTAQRRPLAQAGLARARARFSWPAWAQATASLLRALVERRPLGADLEAW